MLSSFSISKSGLFANQEKLDAISSNIANIGTTAYKKVNVSFKDLLTEKLDKKGIPLNDKTSVSGTGVRTSNWYIDNTQGNIQETSLKTDLAIDGEGYFKVFDSEGNEYYTRDGSFQLDAYGRLVNNTGHILEIQYDNINDIESNTLNSNKFSIDKEGNIHITKDEGTIFIGHIKTYSAIGNDSFISVGGNLKISTEGANVMENKNRDILQGYLETSNVDLTEEFTDMIITQRAFELSSKGLQTADEMWGMVNNIKK